MKGQAYGMTLMIMLVVVNIMLYMYGVDINASSVMTGMAQQRGTGTAIAPNGTQVGGFLSPQSLNNIIMTIIAAIGIAVGVGIFTSYFGASYSMFFTIPTAMILVFLVWFLTPMGNIIKGTADIGSGQACYDMRTTYNATTGNYDPVIYRFGRPINRTCVPWQFQVFILLIFGALLVGAFMSFVGGRPW